MDKDIIENSKDLTAAKTSSAEKVSSSNGKEVSPKLRFKNSNEDKFADWKLTCFGDFIKELTELTSDTKEYPLYSLTLENGVTPKSSRYEREFLITKEGDSYKIVPPNAFVYNPMNLRFGAIAANHNNFSVSVSGYYDVFYMGSDKTLAFWENYLTTPTMLHYYFSIATGSLIEKLRVHFTQFIKIERKIPCLQEQQKIADFLSLIDKRIELQRQLVENLKKYKRGSIFKIFSLENNLNSYIPMSELLTEINDRNTQGLQVCSVAVNKGVINQIEHLGRSFSARDTSNYRCVHYGDIVYTKSPTGDFPYGIVKQSKINENVAVSPLYGVYKPVDYATGNLIHYYFEQAENANNYIRSLAQKGAKNTINIATSHFLEKNILFPRDTVKRVFYSEYLDKINGLILSNEKYLYKLQEIKRGLLQQMFI